MKNLDTRQLADYLSVTKRTIQRRALKEHWPYEEERGLGGVRRLYPFAELPEGVKFKVIASVITSYELEKKLLPEDFTHPEGEPGQSTENGEVFEVSDTQHDERYEELATEKGWMSRHVLCRPMERAELNKSFVKLGILSLAKLYVSELGLPKIRGYDEFSKRFNEMSLPVEECVYSVIGRISRITLLRWEKAGLPKDERFIEIMEKAEFVDKVFEKKLRAMAEEVVMIAPSITPQRLRFHLQTFFAGKPIPSEHMIQRWMVEWHKE